MRNSEFYYFGLNFMVNPLIMLLFSHSLTDSSVQQGLPYMHEELDYMVLALGLTRSKICLARLQELCAIDPDILTREKCLNWFPFSMIEQMDEAPRDDDPIRMCSYSEVTRMLQASMTPNFNIAESENKGVLCLSHFITEYIIII